MYTQRVYAAPWLLCLRREAGRYIRRETQQAGVGERGSGCVARPRGLARESDDRRLTFDNEGDPSRGYRATTLARVAPFVRRQRWLRSDSRGGGIVTHSRMLPDRMLPDQCSPTVMLPDRG